VAGSGLLPRNPFNLAGLFNLEGGGRVLEDLLTSSWLESCRAACGGGETFPLRKGRPRGGVRAVRRWALSKEFVIHDGRSLTYRKKKGTQGGRG